MKLYVVGSAVCAATAFTPIPALALTDAGTSVSAVDLPLALPVPSASALAAFKTSPTWQQFESRHGHDWAISWDERTHVARWITGAGISLGAVNSDSVERACLDLVAEHPDLFGVHPSELRLSGKRNVGGRWFVTFDRYYEGLAVGGGRVDFRIMPNGQLTLIGINTHPLIDLPTQPRVSAAEAYRTAASTIGAVSLGSDPNAELLIVPLAVEEDIGYALAWKVTVATAAPVARWVHYVDAETGAVIARWNEVRYAQIGGTIGGTILPETPTDTPEYRPFADENFTVDAGDSDRSDAEGIWRATVSSGDHSVESTLSGAWQRVMNQNGEDAALAASAPANERTDLVWDDENSTIDERGGYYHLNVVHDYMKAIDPDFTSLDYPMAVRVKEPSGNCNAYWDGLGVTFFEGGGGCPSIVRIADVVYHEYGHGTTQWASGGRATGSMHEGFSDYLGTTITNNPQIGRGFFGPGSHLRDCVNNVVYPAPECGGEVHCVGQAHCGALWDARTNLIAALGYETGVALSDSLWHYARYGHADNDLDYYTDYLFMDDDDGDLSNGTPHGEYLFPALAAHGFAQLLYPSRKFVYDAETPDLVADAGDQLTCIIHYALPLGAMGADNLSASIESLAPEVQVVKAASTFPNVAPGGETDNASDPFLLSVDSDLTELLDVQLVVNLTANPNFFNRADTITVRIGRSAVLLVDDDPADDYSAFYEEPLEELGNRPNLWTTRITGELSFNPLLGFDSVMWFCGDGASDATLSEADQDAIAAYLEQGGKLFLTGQNIAEDISSSDFFGNYLKSEFDSPNAGVPLADGAEGSALTADWHLFFTGTGGANNWYSPDAIHALGGADDVLFYAGSGFGAGVLYDAEYKLLYLPFNFEGVTGAEDTSTRLECLRDVLEFFEIPVGIHAVDLNGRAEPNGNLLTWRLVGADAKLASVRVYRLAEDDRLVSLTDDPLVTVDRFLDKSAQSNGLYRYRMVIRSSQGAEETAAEIEIRRGESPGLPSHAALAQNTPNPFNPRTVIRFDLPQATRVRLSIYDLTGRRIISLVDGERGAGRHQVVWNGITEAGRNAPSGVYVYRIEAGTFTAVKRMLLLK
jgi:Zn-dependent metalloprotease